MMNKSIRRPPTTPRAKRCVGRYELEWTIGQGTFAKVRFATNIDTGEPVAIKILNKEYVMKHKMVDQITREISTMKLIKHPNVVRLLEVMGSKSKIFIVLEYIMGGMLLDKITENGRLTEDDARKYFQQLVNAVDCCHSKGIYHRDLKPENLLLDEYDNLKISDFGLSTLSQQEDDDLLYTRCGTPNYVAPEVIDGEGYDGAKADIWSCGVILFLMLTGYLPFEDDNILTLYNKISAAELIFPSSLSCGAVRLITRILDPNPSTRITIPEILDDEWFKISYTTPEFNKNYYTDTDDTDTDMELHDNHVTTETEDKPQSMNAFRLISLSRGLNLGNLFDVDQDFRCEMKFISKCPEEIIEKVEKASMPLGFCIQRNNYKMRLKNAIAGRKGNLNVDMKIFQVAPPLHVIEVRKAKGDGLEFHKFCRNLSLKLKDSPSTREAEENMHSSLEP